MEKLAPNPILLPAPPSHRRSTLHLQSETTFLILVTLIGAALRLICLSRPTLWNDEVMTYSRICGTHRQMLDILRDDAFGPLHYELNWLLAQVFTMTPALMRLLPAIAGTLMIPAIYLMGLEMFGRRVARLSCGLAACSAFLLAYSRDAKMYMELWVALTLHIGLLFTALRTGHRWPWAGWFISGIAAVWLHATGFIIVPLDLLIVLFHPRGNMRRTMMILLALVVTGAGPVWYATGFSRVPQHLHREGWDAIEITWVSDRSRGHTTEALLADTAGAFAFAYSWIEEPRGRATLSAWTMLTAACLLSTAGILLVIAMLPWKALGHDAEKIDVDADEASRWRSTFLISLWIIGPTYTVYRISANHPISLMDVGKSLMQSPVQEWIAGAIGLAAIVWMAAILRARMVLAVLAILFSSYSVTIWICGAILRDKSSPDGASAWMPTGLPVTGAAIVAIACMVTLAFHRHGEVPSERWRRAGRHLFLFATCLALCIGIDLLMKQPMYGSVWMPRYLGPITPALLVGSAAILYRLPWPALRWFAVGLFLTVNLSQAIAHLICDTEPPLDRIAADVIQGGRPSSSTLVYTPDTSHTFGPNAMGSITNDCGLYYLLMKSTVHLSPDQFRNHPVQEFFQLRQMATAAVVERDLSRNPDTRHLVIWNRDDEGDRLEIDRAMENLSPLWKKRSVRLFPVRSFWNWGFHYGCRRTEYLRAE